MKSPIATKIQRLEDMTLVDRSNGGSKIISPLILVIDDIPKYAVSVFFILLFLLPIRASIRKMLLVPMKAKWLFVIVAVGVVSFELGYLFIEGTSAIDLCACS